ncbi:MAG: iron-sulfur cluster assembly scaffold protein [Chloroflexi bacterium]|nr:iron-sulfur cluster assembly scaffold protein [Chloroflexota bacterium]
MYGSRVVDHFSNPRNLGRLDDPDGVGQVEDATSDTFLTVYLKLDRRHSREAVIVDARFRALGCSACIATGSIVTELAIGSTLDEALLVDSAAIEAALEYGIPEKQHYCVELAARALRKALDAVSA